LEFRGRRGEDASPVDAHTRTASPSSAGSRPRKSALLTSRTMTTILISHAMSTWSRRRRRMTTTISDHIKHDLASRIERGLGPPAELTLTALSRHYGVSFTPVREAIRDL